LVDLGRDPRAGNRHPPTTAGVISYQRHVTDRCKSRDYELTLPELHGDTSRSRSISEGAMTRGKRNDVQRLREEQLMSKAELARRAGVSVLTIDRVERGNECRVDTKRKIILALGYNVGDRRKVFFDGHSGGHR